MASGNTLLTLEATAAKLPATLFAQFANIAGTSTPVESITVLDFDSTTQEYVDFHCVMPRHYAGGGITITIYWIGSATSGEVCWAAALRRVGDDIEDLDTTAFAYSYQSIGAGATAPSAVGEVAYDTIAFTEGAQMDSVAVGEAFILRISRDTADADDDMTGDARLWMVEVRES